jgi:two-component sensor histidine kinase
VERFATAGPDIAAGAGAFTGVALLLHELAINAAKYGSLSVPTGRIAIGCRQEGERFILTWQELGGPCWRKRIGRTASAACSSAPL